MRFILSILGFVLFTGSIIAHAQGGVSSPLIPKGSRVVITFSSPKLIKGGTKQTVLCALDYPITADHQNLGRILINHDNTPTDRYLDKLEMVVESGEAMSGDGCIILKDGRIYCDLFNFGGIFSGHFEGGTTPISIASLAIWNNDYDLWSPRYSSLEAAIRMSFAPTNLEQMRNIVSECKGSIKGP